MSVSQQRCGLLPRACVADLPDARAVEDRLHAVFRAAIMALLACAETGTLKAGEEFVDRRRRFLQLDPIGRFLKAEKAVSRSKVTDASFSLISR